MDETPEPDAEQRAQERKKDMAASRREFMALSSFAALAAALESSPAASAGAQVPPQQQETPGAPTAFGTSPAVGPEVTADDFAHAEKLVQVTLTEPERAEAAGNWRMQMAPNYELRTGPRKLSLGPTLQPATLWNPAIPQVQLDEGSGVFMPALPPAGELPRKKEDIAYAPVSQLAKWIESGALTSEELTKMYLNRLEQYGPQLRCVITLTRDHALEQAKAADREISQGIIAGRCTEFRGARRICSIPQTFPPLMARSLTEIASPQWTAPSCNG